MGTRVATGYLVSPLKLARPGCKQLLSFAERGLRMGIGHLPSQGGTPPVSFAGALTLALAEQMFLFLLRQAFWGDAEWSVSGSLATMEIRWAVPRYGRPERQRTNLALADIARFYGCARGVHGGLSDAEVPSLEAGAQKAIGASVSAPATGSGSVSVGLLSMDEVCSPVQMVLDDDLAGAVRAPVREPLVDDLERAFEEVASVGPGGDHLGTGFTLARHHTDIQGPCTWSRELANGWLGSGRQTDVGCAQEFVREFERDFEFVPCVSQEEERELRGIVAHAVETGRAQR